MKLVILEKNSLGTDLDISFYNDFGESVTTKTLRRTKSRNVWRTRILLLQIKHL